MRIRKLFTVAALTAILLAGACDQVNFTAPAGSTITITAQPPTIAVNGFSNVTVTGTRENGAPLPDGTTIDFTSNLGTVTPNPVETKDGVARTQLKAGTRSGTATITARSGGAAEVTVDIVIGEARATQMVLVLTPQTLPFGGGKVQVRARVTDADGNALSGIGVIFTTSAGTLESRGRVIRTDDGGVSRDVLTTNLDAIVTATTSNGVTQTSENIDVSPGEGPVCSFTISPSPAIVGQTIFFADTSTTQGPAIVQSLWDFGDGSTDEGLTVEHVYDNDGDFTVIHTVIDETGFSTVCTETVSVSRGEPICTFTFDPPNPEPSEPVDFDASDSDDPDGFIVSWSWDFGDGTSAFETDPTITHAFPSVGTFTVVLTVTDDDGLQKVCTEQVFVSIAPTP